MAYSSTTVSAAEEKSLTTESRVLVGDGYTENGVYYEVYDVTVAAKEPTRSVRSVNVKREVVYNSFLPYHEIPQSIPWSEHYDSYTITRGTLEYTGFVYDKKNKKTIVYYSGTLVGRV